MQYPYFISDVKNLIILLLFSVISVFVTNKYDLNLSDVVKKTKEKQIIFLTLFLLIENKLLRLGFYWIKDYLLVIKFDANWGIEKPKLSTSNLLTQSFVVFSILTVLYLIIYV